MGIGVAPPPGLEPGSNSVDGAGTTEVTGRAGRVSAAVYESVLDAIGQTPLIRLDVLGRDLAVPIYAKVDFLSVGGSVKDRAALAMVEQAEKDGLLRPGGTIVEATSGNTGIGLTIVGRRKGYRVIVGVPLKSSAEKVDILTAYGAEVVRADTALPKQHPDHLFNVVRRLVADIPGAWLADQYDNPANPQAHVATTGPEIWSQTTGRLTHFVAGVGTGGTISGTGRYLKDISDGAVTVIGADPESSVYSGGDGSPYYVESIGHFVHPQTIDDLWPNSFHPDVVDRFETISDRESLLTARRLAREEGLLVGPSSGTAVAAALRVARGLSRDDVVVVLLPDSGRSYLSRYHNDNWLREWGFLEDAAAGTPTVRGVVERNGTSTVTVAADDRLCDVAKLAGSASAALPVVLPRDERRHGVAVGEVLGSVSPAQLRADIDAGRADPTQSVGSRLSPLLPTAGIGQSIDDAASALGAHPSVVVLEDGRVRAVLDRAHLTPTTGDTP